MQTILECIKFWFEYKVFNCSISHRNYPLRSFECSTIFHSERPKNIMYIFCQCGKWAVQCGKWAFIYYWEIRFLLIPVQPHLTTTFLKFIWKIDFIHRILNSSESNRLLFVRFMHMNFNQFAWMLYSILIANQSDSISIDCPRENTKLTIFAHNFFFMSANLASFRNILHEDRHSIDSLNFSQSNTFFAHGYERIEFIDTQNVNKWNFFFFVRCEKFFPVCQCEIETLVLRMVSVSRFLSPSCCKCLFLMLKFC